MSFLLFFVLGRAGEVKQVHNASAKVHMCQQKMQLRKEYQGKYNQFVSKVKQITGVVSKKWGALRDPEGLSNVKCSNNSDFLDVPRIRIIVSWGPDVQTWGPQLIPL